MGLRRGLVFGGTEEILGDEPDWTRLLTVVTIELDERDVRAGALASVDEINESAAERNLRHWLTRFATALMATAIIVVPKTNDRIACLMTTCRSRFWLMPVSDTW